MMKVALVVSVVIFVLVVVSVIYGLLLVIEGMARSVGIID